MGIRVPRLVTTLVVVSILLSPLAPTTAAPALSKVRAAAIAFARSDFATGSTGSIDSSVFDIALSAASCAVRANQVDSPQTLTVIDYSRPSTEKRLWVFDLETHALLYEELVAHGQGSGGNRASLFSNEPNTHQSSLGLFVTDQTYVGTNGYSLRLDGLDEGLNDRARERAIVMHGAPYVSEGFIHANRRLGRSWGCPAIRNDAAREIIDRIKGGGLVFAYHPDDEGLKSSTFLGGCPS